MPEDVVCGEDIVLAHRWPPSHCILTRGESSGPFSSYEEETNPNMRALAFLLHLNLNTSQWLHLQIQSHGGLGPPYMNFEGGDTNIQFMTNSA